MSTLDHPTTDSLTFHRKFNLNLKEPPMTIIAAMRESADSALIAKFSRAVLETIASYRATRASKHLR